MATTDAEQIVNRFVGAWEHNDVDELLEYFTDDAVWHPMPVKPAVGKPAIRQAISRWLDMVDQLSGEIHLQVSEGGVVMHERTDRYLLGGRQVEHAIGAVFEIENGLITAWREYFDMSDFLVAQDEAPKSEG